MSFEVSETNSDHHPDEDRLRNSVCADAHRAVGLLRVVPTPTLVPNSESRNTLHRTNRERTDRRTGLRLQPISTCYSMRAYIWNSGSAAGIASESPEAPPQRGDVACNATGGTPTLLAWRTSGVELGMAPGIPPPSAQRAHRSSISICLRSSPATPHIDHRMPLGDVSPRSSGFRIQGVLIPSCS